jgi:hypothetical protein
VSNSISRAYLLIEGCSVGDREGKFTCERWTETEMDACHWGARPYKMALVRVPCVVIKAVFGTLVLVILSCVWWTCCAWEHRHVWSCKKEISFMRAFVWADGL